VDHRRYQVKSVSTATDATIRIQDGALRDRVVVVVNASNPIVNADVIDALTEVVERALAEYDARGAR
jgi:hypothetical protein